MDTPAPIGNLAGALARFQGLVPDIPKTRTATVPLKSGGKYSYTYADLADVLRAVRTPLAQCELAIWQALAPNNGAGLLLVTTLAHSSGESVSSTLPVPDTGANPQSLGSWLTYGRRYSITALLGICADDDDDGAGGNGSHAHAPPPPRPPALPPTSSPPPTSPAPQAPARPAPPPRPPAPTPSPEDGAKVMRMIHVAGTSVGLGHDDISAYARAHYKGTSGDLVGSLTELSPRQLSHLLDQVKGGHVAEWLIERSPQAGA